MTTTANEAYFMTAVSALPDADHERIFELAVNILRGLPDDTDQGQTILRMIAKRYPDRAKPVFRSFLENGNATRGETMCRVLWYNNPMSIEILAPLLDDKTQLEGFVAPMRLCDRAAQAISHTTEQISFDSEWSTTNKDQQIDRLKRYCEDHSK